MEVKLVRVELIRRRLGDKRAEAFLKEVFGPDLMGADVKAETLSKTLAALNGQGNGRGPKYVPVTFQAYFARNRRARTNFVAWLETEYAAKSSAEAPKVALKPQRGRKKKVVR